MYKKYFKRLLDIIFSVILLLLTLPLMLLVAILIKLNSKGPALFIQDRIGHKGKVFKIYKFRTMHVAYEEEQIKMADKDRIFHFGLLLRKTSIDELPQLWNILKGEMSFIGPRPFMDIYLNLDDPVEFRRHDVIPGVTGMAQVNGRTNLSYEVRFKYDLYYVDNFNFLLDIKILIKTIIKLFSFNDVNIDDDTANTRNLEADIK